MRTAQKLVLRYLRTKFKILSSISNRKAATEAFKLFCTPQYRNKKKLPRIFEEAEKIRFQFQNYSIQGYRWNKDAKQKVLILHGFESSVINFDRYVKPLILKEYCVLAFDAPAHGRSSGKSVNVIAYRDFITYIHHHYGPVNSFISHSFGGLALCHAQETWNVASEMKYVLIAPAAETTTAIDSFFKLMRLKVNVRKCFDDIIEKKSGHRPEWFSVTRVLKNTAATVLICQDRNDHMTPISDLSELIGVNKPNIKFYITDGLGHRRIYRDNKVFKAIIEFL